MLCSFRTAAPNVDAAVGGESFAAAGGVFCRAIWQVCTKLRSELKSEGPGDCLQLWLSPECEASWLHGKKKPRGALLGETKIGKRCAIFCYCFADTGNPSFLLDGLHNLLIAMRSLVSTNPRTMMADLLSFLVLLDCCHHINGFQINIL